MYEYIVPMCITLQGKFLKGAAIVGAAQQGYQNVRSGQKSKSAHKANTAQTDLKN